MNHGMASALVLILLITCPGIVRGQSLGETARVMQIRRKRPA